MRDEQKKRYFACIDVGGTSIKYGIVEEDNTKAIQLLHRGERPTQAMQDGGPGIMKKIKEIITSYQEEYVLEGICISTAGMVDCEKGEIFYAAPLIPNYTGTKIKETLEQVFGIPCEVENDVNCAGLAEYTSGAGKGSKICLCLTIGTGIGGCIVMNGEVFHGAGNSACEVGYMQIDGEEYQTLGSAKTMVEKVTQRKNLPAGSINGKDVFQLAKDGDSICIQAIDEMCEVIGKGIANICYVLNPDRVILGGGVMEQKEYLYPRICKAMDQYLVPGIREKTSLCFAQHGNEAGILGSFYHYQKLKSRKEEKDDIL